MRISVHKPLPLPRLLCWILACLPVLLALAQAHAADPPGTTTVTGVTFIAPMPRTDGVNLLWYDPGGAPERRHGLYVASIANPRPRFIADTGNIPLWYDIGNGIVVWQIVTLEQSIIHGLRLDSGERFTLAAQDVRQWAPAVSGSSIAWAQNEGQQQVIKLRDLGAGSSTTVAVIEPGWGVDQILLDRSRVVWLERGTADANAPVEHWRVRSAVSGGGASTIVEHVGARSRLDFQGTVVIYTKDAVLYAHDLQTNSTRSLAQTVEHATTDGRFVVWSSSCRSVVDQQTPVELYGYDLQTDSRFNVSTHSGVNQCPHLRKGVLTWGRGVHPDYSVQLAMINRAIPSAWRAAADQPGQTFFPETGHGFGGVFQAFWQRSGGLPVFGYPLTEEYAELNRDTQRFHSTQFFERQRFEHHPQHAGTPYEVQLGRLGVEVLLQQGRDWAALPKADPAKAHYFAATGHAIAPEFWDYWRGHGLEFGDAGVSHREALALFGMPISEPQLETNSSGDRVLTQWFERARFEYHPTNPAPYNVLLGRLGDELIVSRGW